MKCYMYKSVSVYIYLQKKIGRKRVGHCVLEEKFYINTDMSICRRRPIEMFSVLCCI